MIANAILSLCKKCPYSELFWSVFCPNAGKCGPEQLRIRTLFTVLFTSSLHNQMQLTFDENVHYIQKSICFSQNKCSVNQCYSSYFNGEKKSGKSDQVFQVINIFLQLNFNPILFKSTWILLLFLKPDKERSPIFKKLFLTV